MSDEEIIERYYPFFQTMYRQYKTAWKNGGGDMFFQFILKRHNFHPSELDTLVEEGLLIHDPMSFHVNLITDKTKRIFENLIKL